MTHLAVASVGGVPMTEKEKAAKDFAVEFHIEYGNREAEDEVIAEAIYLLERGFLAGWNERDKHPHHLGVLPTTQDYAGKKHPKKNTNKVLAK